MYKVFRTECIEGVEFVADRFDFDWELAGKLVRLGYTPIEIPVEYNARWFRQGQEGSILPRPADLGRCVPPVSVLFPSRCSVATTRRCRNETGGDVASRAKPDPRLERASMRWMASHGRTTPMRAETSDVPARADPAPGPSTRALRIVTERRSSTAVPDGRTGSLAIPAWSRRRVSVADLVGLLVSCLIVVLAFSPVLFGGRTLSTAGKTPGTNGAAPFPGPAEAGLLGRLPA